MARDQYEYDEGGFLVDRYGRKQYTIATKHATPLTTDVQRGYKLTDADGREQIVLTNPDAIGLPASVVNTSSQSELVPLRITVGKSAPASPSANDLWLSTSWADVRVGHGPQDKRVLIAPSQAWETNVCQEPFVWFDGTNWNLVYHGFNDSMGWATCPGTSDPTVAANWTKYGSNPFLASNVGGGIYYEAGTLYVYYGGTGGLHVRSGTDPAHLGADLGIALANGQQGTVQSQNPRVLKIGSTYYMFFASTGGPISYSAGYATATSPLGPFTVAVGNFPLTSLQPATTTTTVDGPVVQVEGSTYVGWFHSDKNNPSNTYPQDIYRATSTDLVNWTILDSKTPVIRRTMPQEGDQCADVNIATASNGLQFAVWSAWNNDLVQASVMCAPLCPVLKRYNGSAWELLQPTSSAYVSGLNQNEYFGMAALAAMLQVAGVSGAGNTAIGTRTMETITDGQQNTAVGGFALNKLATGNGWNANVAVGFGAMQLTTGAGSCTAIGYQALQAADNASYNTAVGYQASKETTGAILTTSIGYQAAPTNNNATAIGARAAASGNGSVAIGCDHTGAGASATAQDVIALGTANHQVQLKNNTTGAGSAALGANSPAITNTAPYTWFKMMSSDGSTVYVPAWK